MNNLNEVSICFASQLGNYVNILLFHDKKNNKWMLPTHKIDKNKSRWNTACQGFAEGYGKSLLDLSIEEKSLKSFIHNDNTYVYYGCIRRVLPSPNINKMEQQHIVDKIRWVRYDELDDYDIKDSSRKILKYMENHVMMQNYS